MIVAVDGPAAAGKGTIARGLARHFGYHFLDTGSLYRMVGLAVLRAKRDPGDREAAAMLARALNPAAFRDEDLRSEAVAAAASRVAVIPEVRAALLDLQRAFARKGPGAVLDGRDIGTVVCPDAEVKLFVTASPEVRAARRQRELGSADFAAVLADIRARDARDAGRSAAPLTVAPDAVVIDTSDMSVDQALAVAVAAVERARRPPASG